MMHFMTWWHDVWDEMSINILCLMFRYVWFYCVQWEWYELKYNVMWCNDVYSAMINEMQCFIKMWWRIKMMYEMCGLTKWMT